MTKWQKVKLGDICEISSGGTPSRANNAYWYDGTIPWVKISDMNSKYIDGTEEMITQQGVDNSSAKLYKKGTLLYSIFASIGEVGILNIDATCNQAIAGLEPKHNICKNYVYYVLKALKRLVSKKGRGVAQNNINLSILRNIEIPLPPREEQERIAKELDAVADLLEKQKQLLSEQDTLIKSIFYDMFGDPVTNDKGWKIEKLEKFVDVIGGYAFKSGLFKKTGIPVLRIGNINTGVLKVDNLTFWDNDKSLSKYVVYPKDLVISLTGTVGKDDYANVCILSGEYNKYYLNQRNAHIVIKTSIDNVYLFCLLRNKEVKSRLTGISRGVRQANISNKDILNLLIPVPPLPLQQKFAAVVEQIEVQKQKIKSAITETETLFNTLMAKYFDE